MPELLALELYNIASSNAIVSQNHAPVDHSVFATVCCYGAPNFNWCKDVVGKMHTQSKANVALQHANSVAIFVPLI